MFFSGRRASRAQKLWIPGFDVTQSIFIHIPKSAGTSISSALYGEDPWHYRISQYQHLHKKKFSEYFKFAFVRNPYERVLSTYLYSFDQAKRHPTTSVAFVTKYPSFEEFVCDWLTDDNVQSHYFFLPQFDYVSDIGGERILVDFIGRMETLAEDFGFVKSRLGLDVELPLKNASSGTSRGAAYTEAARETVARVYAKDFETFCYPT